MGRILTIFEKIFNSMKTDKKDAVKPTVPKKSEKNAKKQPKTVRYGDFKDEVLSEARAVMVRRGRSSINVADLEDVLSSVAKKMQSNDE
jgi:hypothetical protein